MDEHSKSFLDMAGTSEISTVGDESLNNSRENELGGCNSESYSDTGSPEDDQNYSDHSDTKGPAEEGDENDHSNTETRDDDRDNSDLSNSSESRSIYRYEGSRKGESSCEGSDLISTHALKLENMASVTVAIALWNHATVSVPGLKLDEYHYRRWLFDQVPKWIAQLRLPKLLAKYVENQFHDIVINVYCWIHFHTNIVKMTTDLHRCMDSIVWYPNGAINDYETAVNLMKLDELGDEEKYRLACTYCMKEEIEKRRMTLIGNPVLKIRINKFYRDPLVTYWNCYYSGKLHMIPVEGKFSVDAFMMRQMYFINWPAVEYFFDRLNGNVGGQIIIPRLYFQNCGSPFW